jgi:hypothetical protein
MKVSRDTFINIDCPLDLAKKLDINPRALLYVTLVSPSKPCKNPYPKKCNGCPFPSVAYNGGYCICCRQSWFPQKPRPHYSMTFGGRGNLLLGPEFQRRASPNMLALTRPPAAVNVCLVDEEESVEKTQLWQLWHNDTIVQGTSAKKGYTKRTRKEITKIVL